MIYETLKCIYRKSLPEKLRIFIKMEIHVLYFNLYKRNLKRKILTYYEYSQNSDNIENLKGLINFLRTRPIHVFPYDFIDKYQHEKVEVFRDKELKLFYIFYNKKRLYFKRGFTKNEVRNYFKSLLVEQDIDSPHRYIKDNFGIQRNDIVVDIGAAEGIFGLSIIDSVSEIYIFESDESWIEALTASFRPWSNKVTIVQSFVTNETVGNHIRLDDYFMVDNGINFIKIDVEGEEQNVILGAKDVLEKGTMIKLVISTYHKQNDSLIIKQLLQSYGFVGDFSDGYMLFFHDKNIEPPFFRKGLLRATKAN